MHGLKEENWDESWVLDSNEIASFWTPVESNMRGVARLAFI